jgi:hypothetical protein
MVKIASHPYYTAQRAAPAHGVRNWVGEDEYTGHSHCPLGYYIKFLYSYNKTNEIH